RSVANINGLFAVISLTDYADALDFLEHRPQTNDKHLMIIGKDYDGHGSRFRLMLVRVTEKTAYCQSPGLQSTFGMLNEMRIRTLKNQPNSSEIIASALPTIRRRR